MSMNRFYRKVIYKDAGLLKYPKDLFEDMFKWTAYKYAQSVLNCITDLIKNAGWSKEKIVEAHRVINLCKSISKKSSPISETDTSSTWKFNDNYFDLIVGFVEKKAFSIFHGQLGGTFNLETQEITVWQSPNVYTTGAFKLALENIHLILKHELQHFMQFIGLPASHENYYSSFGIPGQKIIDKTEPSEEHALLDTEFYTRLSDEVEYFIYDYGKVPQKFKKQIACGIVGLGMDTDKIHPSFKTIKPSEFFYKLMTRQPEKWKKAVKEFFKAIGVLE